MKSSSVYLSYNILGILLLFIMAACVGPEKEPVPDNLVAEGTYINLLVEMQLIQTHRNAQPDSVNVDSLKKLVYQKYKVDEEQFLESHRYYQKQVDEQIKRVNTVIDILKKEKQKTQAYIDSMKIVHARQDSLIQADSTSQTN